MRKKYKSIKDVEEFINNKLTNTRIKVKAFYRDNKAHRYILVLKIGNDVYRTKCETCASAIRLLEHLTR